MNRRNLVKSVLAGGILGATSGKILASQPENRDSWKLASSIMKIGCDKTGLKEGEEIKPGDFLFVLWYDATIFMRVNNDRLLLNASEVVRQKNVKENSLRHTDDSCKSFVFIHQHEKKYHEGTSCKIDMYTFFITNLIWGLRTLIPEWEKEGIYTNQIAELKKFFKSKNIDL